MGVTFNYQPPKVNALALMAAAKVAGETAGANVLLAKSRELAPKDTGTMAAEAYVEHQGAAGAAVIYPTTSADGYHYPARQHEDLSLNHPHGGEGKFLEKPMNSDHAEIAVAAIEPIRRVFA